MNTIGNSPVELAAYEVGYREGGSDVAADWHIALSEEGLPPMTFTEAAKLLAEQERNK